MKETEKKKYPTGTEHYILYEEIGQGVSASVHRAICVPFNEIVAIKILDFERDNCDLNSVSREAQTMILVDHPNVLKSHCSFVSDHNLWVVMPFMAGGSCLHILKAAYPDGFGEIVIATILREALKGLEYLHRHGHIHRDVKAGNILIDADGAIKLGDFGVSACLFDSGDRQRTRNTFVGTPCWMAPEVLAQMHGYDFKADIWSFGITALELAHGHAPFSKYPPMKVLLMTLQSAPPGLDYERDRKFSKSFKQMIAGCLVKDPSKRPTATKLLKNSFFKQARSNDYIVRKILEGLPALGDRMKAIKRKEEAMLAQKRMPDGEMEELSQNEYKRGISSWNFNLEDMKAQASLIHDFDDPISDNNQGGSSSSLSAFDAQDKPSSIQNPSQIPNMPFSNSPEDNNEQQSQLAPVPLLDSLPNDAKFRFEKSNNDCNVNSPSHEQCFSQNSLPHLDEHSEHNSVEKINMENVGRPVEGTAIHSLHRRVLSSSILSEATCSSIREESAKLQNQSQNISNCNATTILQIGEDLLSELPSKVSNLSATSDDTDEKARIPVVQQKGRFKVTSENVDLEKVGPSPVLQKSQSMQVIATQNPMHLSSLPVSLPSEATSSNVSVNSISKLLHSVLQTNIQQRDDILGLIKRVTGSDSTVNGACNPAQVAASEKCFLDAAHDRERDLLLEISELQWRLICAQEELQKLKTETT